MQFKSLGNNIRKYRKKLGLTQKELGEKILKSEISIRKYEQGSINIPPATLFSLCNIFNVDLGTLLDDDIHSYIQNNKKHEQELNKIVLQQTNEVLSENTKKLSDLTSRVYELEKFGHSEHEYILNIQSKPNYLLSTILSYLENTEEYYTGFNVDLGIMPRNNDKFSYYLTEKQVNSIINKVTSLVKNEIEDIENNDELIFKKGVEIAKKILNKKQLVKNIETLSNEEIEEMLSESIK